MSGLLERCARAVCALHCTECGYVHKCGDGWLAALPDARAVLRTATADITDDMMAALFAAGDIASLHPIIKANLTALLATLTELRKATR